MTVIVHHNTDAHEHPNMITLRKRFSTKRTRRTMVPAFLFLAAATFTATGSGAMAALCLVPAGLVFEASRDDNASNENA